MEMLILGFLIGLAVSPMLRSWIAWREYAAASREAWLTEETIRRLEREDSSEGPPPTLRREYPKP